MAAGAGYRAAHARVTPGTGRGGQYLAADSLAMWATDHIPGTIWVIVLHDQHILSGAWITGHESRQASTASTAYTSWNSKKNLVLP